MMYDILAVVALIFSIAALAFNLGTTNTVRKLLEKWEGEQ